MITVRFFLVGTALIPDWVAGSSSRKEFPLVAQYKALHASLVSQYSSATSAVLTEEQKSYSCPPLHMFVNTIENAKRVTPRISKFEQLAKGSGSILRLYKEDGHPENKFVVKAITSKRPSASSSNLINEKAILGVLKEDYHCRVCVAVVRDQAAG